jgi:capsular exopolysaccharide synthesis family protein
LIQSLRGFAQKIDPRRLSVSGYSGIYNEGTAQQAYVKSLVDTLRRRWLFILAGTILLFTVLAVAIQLLPKTYQGIASVEVLSKTPTVANPDIITGDQTFTDETAGTELGIFTSQELRTAVVRKLGLIDVPEFNPNLRPSLLHHALLFIKQSPVGRILPDGVLPDLGPPSPEKALFDTVQKFGTKVTVEPVSHSKIIQVTVTAKDPVLAASVANATVAQYILTHQQQKEDAYKQAYDFTKDRLPSLRADMIAKSTLVNKFRQEHNMVSGQYAAIRREKLTEASKALVEAQTKLEQLKAALEQSKAGDMMSNPAVLSSLTIERLREQQAQLLAEGAGHQAMAPTYALRAQSFDQSIRSEAIRIIKSLPSQVAAQEQVVATQRHLVDAIQDEVSRVDTLQSELDPLENDARIATKQYSDFLSSDSVSRPDVAFTAVNVRVLSSAAVPYEPYFPNNKLMLPVALVLSFFCNCGLALYHGRRVGFVTTAQFQDVFQTEPIGRIPLRTKAYEQAYWEAVMFLSMKLCRPYERTKQTILVTSAQPNEGKTTISMSLAEVFARRNISVALVDADMRIVRKLRPGQEPVVGLRDVLGAAVPLERAMVRTNGVTVIQAGSNRTASPTSLIASDMMPHLLHQLRESHDIIIIDGPPAPVGGDSWALSKLVDRVLFIVKQSDTGEQQVQDAFRALDKVPGDLDVVLNMVRHRDDPAISFYDAQRL